MQHKTLVLSLALSLVGTCTLSAGEHPWLRRATTVAACAASFWDLQTTRQATAIGAREDNSFFANKDGTPKLGKMAIFKGTLCASTFAFGEFHVLSHVAWSGELSRSDTREISDWAIVGLAGVQTGLFSLTAVHNRRTYQQQKAINEASRQIWGGK